jgi:hypothetical protein
MNGPRIVSLFAVGTLGVLSGSVSERVGGHEGSMPARVMCEPALLVSDTQQPKDWFDLGKQAAHAYAASVKWSSWLLNNPDAASEALMGMLSVDDREAAGLLMHCAHTIVNTGRIRDVDKHLLMSELVTRLRELDDSNRLLWVKAMIGLRDDSITVYAIQGLEKHQSPRDVVMLLDGFLAHENARVVEAVLRVAAAQPAVQERYRQQIEKLVDHPDADVRLWARHALKQ